METPKRTGLGDSLLLRRTETLTEPPRPVASDVQTPEVIPTVKPNVTQEPSPDETPTPQPAAKKSKKTPLVLRDRCTLYLERTVNEQLHMAARIEGRERSEVVTDILRKHLPKYRIEREK